MAPADGGAGAAKRMAERAERIRNLAPALRVFAEEIVKATDDAFDQSRTVTGKPFPKLAPSTIEARGRKVRGASTKSRKAGTRGRLTASARKARSAAAGSHKPLVDTARARNSAKHTKIRGGDTIQWSAVGYLGPHIHGKGVPQRNPTAFEGKPGNMRLVGKFQRRLSKLVTTYIETGKAA